MSRKILKTTLIVGLFFTLGACAEMAPYPKKNDNAAVAETNIRLGMAYLDKDHIRQANEKLSAALQEDRDLPEAWYSMAFLLEKVGKNPEANQYYLQALQLAPARGDVQNNYGTFLCRTGDYLGAIQHFILAAQDSAYRGKASAYENAGLCALKIPDAALAKNYFKQALAVDPQRKVSRVRLQALSSSNA